MNKSNQNQPRIIISGGGTGGHIFPAISIANAIKKSCPDAQILFVGALGRMEMERVPQAGYRIVGLPIMGFDRKNILRNIKVLYKVFQSQQIAKKIIKSFKPMLAIGVGGYASGPMLNVCSKKNIPIIIQEQNSYAGVTNKILAKKAEKICVAYPEMERFFSKDKIILTGNPIRQNIMDTQMTKQQAMQKFGLHPDKKTILVIGGSLGAETINQSILQNIQEIIHGNIQIIWQTGKRQHLYIKEKMQKHNVSDPQNHKNIYAQNIYLTDFIGDMAAAYQTADLVISRAGAGTISELCALAKPTILVPSPNVAEDHQTKNAMALVNKQAAICVKDENAVKDLIRIAIETVKCDERLNLLSQNIQKLALHDSADIIAKEALQIINSQS